MHNIGSPQVEGHGVLGSVRFAYGRLQAWIALSG